MDKPTYLSFQHPSKSLKLFNEKENEPKHVNKKIDLLTSLQNIKLPSYQTILKEKNFQSLTLNHSLSQEKPSRRTHIVPPPPKKTPTEDFCERYGECLKQIFSASQTPKYFLSHHKIDGGLRARMLDWMVEVMSMYKFQPKTYFAGVQLMDRYFQMEKQSLLPSSLHIIGVEAMLIASKMEEVYPLKVRTVYDKIAHKKIPMQEIINMEAKITKTLDFQLTTSTTFDLACLKIVDYLASEDLYEPLQTSMKEIEEVLACLAKYVTYNYELSCQFSKATLAKVLTQVVLDAFKINIEERERQIEKGRWELQSFLEGQYKEFKDCKQALLDTIGTYKQKFKGLQNLAKFTSKSVLDRIELIVF